LHRLGEPVLRVVGVAETASRQSITQSLAWPNVGRFELRSDPRFQNLLRRVNFPP
jgi:hypothetical protein